MPLVDPDDIRPPSGLVDPDDVRGAGGEILAGLKRGMYQGIGGVGSILQAPAEQAGMEPGIVSRAGAALQKFGEAGVQRNAAQPNQHGVVTNALADVAEAPGAALPVIGAASLGAVGGPVGMAAAGGGAAAEQAWHDRYQQAIRNGVSPDDARSYANSSAVVAAGAMGALPVFGRAAGVAGRIAGRALGMGAADATEAAGGILSKRFAPELGKSVGEMTAANVGSGAVGAAGQAVVDQGATQAAGYQAGQTPQTPGEAALESIPGSLAASVGFVPFSVLHANAGVRAAAQKAKILADPSNPARPAVVKEVYDAMAKTDPEGANMWAINAAEATTAGVPIGVDRSWTTGPHPTAWPQLPAPKPIIAGAPTEIPPSGPTAADQRNADLQARRAEVDRLRASGALGGAAATAMESGAADDAQTQRAASIPEPEPIQLTAAGPADEQAQLNIRSVARAAEPLPLDDAQALVARAEPDTPLTIVPHPSGSGFAVVPDRLLTPNLVDQVSGLQSGAPVAPESSPFPFETAEAAQRQADARTSQTGVAHEVVPHPLMRERYATQPVESTSPEYSQFANSENQSETSHAVQEPSTGTLLQREPLEAGAAGGERERVQPSVEGSASAEAGSEETGVEPNEAGLREDVTRHLTEPSFENADAYGARQIAHDSPEAAGLSRGLTAASDVIHPDELRGMNVHTFDTGENGAIAYPDGRSIGIRSDVLRAAATGNADAIEDVKYYTAHELGHTMDTSDDRTFASSAHPAFDVASGSDPSERAPRGGLMQEAYDAYNKGSALVRKFLDYPMVNMEDRPSDLGLSNEAMVRKYLQLETFAQLHAMYKLHPAEMRAELPKSFDLFERIEHGKRRYGYDVDAARRAVREALRDTNPDGSATEDAARGFGEEIAGRAGNQRAGVAGGTEAEQQSAGSGAQSARSRGGYEEQPDLADLPKTSPGHFEPARRAAAAYMKSAGIKNKLPTAYVKVDPEFSTRIADAYAQMKHDPQNPRVKRAYAAMIKETIAQWHAMMKTGIKIDFTDAEHPYPYKSPMDAVRDVRNNNHLTVFSSDEGFGKEGDADTSDNPLLAQSGIVHAGKPLRANDVFRAVHDYFGHIKEGFAFRHDGEENAWRSHASMYSDLARQAMTSETRGQNSWVNFGPHGEFNRTASGADTIYGEQKAGLLPRIFTEDHYEDLPLEVSKTLTASERTMVGEGRDRATKLLDVMKQMPADKYFDQAAIDGEAARKWYQRSFDAITKVYGDDTPRFMAFMAALSPQTNVKGNFFNAARAWVAWERAGRPMSTAKVERILNDNLVKDESREAGISAMPAWVGNGTRALTASDPLSIRLSGPKVSSFMHNLLGHAAEVTNDRHMADFANINQGELEPAYPKSDGGFGVKRPGYIALNAKVRASAARLGWSPMEVQAAVWSWWNALKKLSNETGRSAVDLLRSGELTRARIAAEPHLGSYLDTEQFRNIDADRGRRAVGLDDSAHGEAHEQGGAARGGDVSPESIANARRLDRLTGKDVARKALDSDDDYVPFARKRTPEDSEKLDSLKAGIRSMIASTRGDMTGAESKRFIALTNELNALRHDIGKADTAEQVDATAAERKSTLTPETHAAMSADVWRDKDIHLALAEASTGVSFNADTAIDRIFNGHNKAVSPQAMYDNFDGTRDALQKQYGDVLTLYRATGKQKDKTTQNFATTREFAAQFGPNVIERAVPVRDVLAANVAGRGRYHELIVGDAEKLGLVKDYTPFAKSRAFYSALERAIDEKAPFAKNDTIAAPILRNWLDARTKDGTVKRDEVQWTGLDDYLKLHGTVTRAQLKEFLDNNGVKVSEVALGDVVGKLPKDWTVEEEPAPDRGLWTVRDAQGITVGQGRGREAAIRDSAERDERTGTDTKFSSYQLPGGKNYRELLLTLPSKSMSIEDAARAKAESQGLNWERMGAEGRARHIGDEKKFNTRLAPGEFKSSHFDQPNILAHVRFNDRTDADGKKVLFIEELQSDWAQKGRKGGFLKPRGDGVSVTRDSDGFVHIRNAAGESVGGYSENAANGMSNDALLDRYNSGAGGTGGIPSGPFVGKTEAWTALALKRMIAYAAEHGYDRVAWTNGAQQNARYPAAGEQGDKIAHGMETFYDKIVPNVANDVLKKLGGGRVGEVPITDSSGDGKSGRYIVAQRGQSWRVMDTEVRGGEYMGNPYKDARDAIAAADELNRGRAGGQPGFDITPQMRDKVAGGLPLFARRNGTKVPVRELAPKVTGGKAAESEQQFTKSGEPVERQPDHDEPAWIREAPPQTQEFLRKAGVYIPKETLRERWSRVKQNLGLRVLQSTLDQYAPVLKYLGKYPYQLLRMASASDNGLSAMIEHGQVELNSVGALKIRAGTDSFKQVMAPLAGEHDRMLAWMAAQRANELMKEGREHNFTQDEINAGLKLNQRMSPSDAFKGEGSRAIAYAKAMKGVSELNASVLDIAEKSGILDPEARKIFAREFYVPFFREEDSGEREVTPGNVSGMVGQYATKRLKGGENQLHDLMANMMQNWSHLLSASLKNNAAKVTLARAEELGIAHRIDAHEKGAVFVREGGKERHWMVDDPLVLQAVSSLSVPSMRGPVMKALAATKHALTVGTTWSPIFRIRHTLREQVTSWASNKTEGGPIKNWIDGFNYSSRSNPEYGNMAAGGAFFNLGMDLEDNRAAYVKRLIEHNIDPRTLVDSDHRALKMLGHFADWWKEVGERSDSITRANLYRQTYKSMIETGKSPDEAHFEASYAARDAMDYSLHGTSPAIRMITQVVPFMNARMQGLYKLGRAAHADPKRFAAVVGGITLATIALALAQRHDKDVQAASDWDKDNNWLVHVGDTMYRIPKPFEVGALATVVERALTVALNGFQPTDREKFANRLLTIVGSQLNLNPVPEAFLPAVELWANKDIFTGEPIEPMRDEKLTSGMHVGPRTSAAAQLASSAMGSVLPDKYTLSPQQIDFAVNAYLGWVGSHAVATADLALRPLGGFPAKPTPRLDDYFLIGDFAHATPSANTQFTSDFYEHLADVQKAFGDMRELQKTGQSKMAIDYMKAHGDLVGLEAEYVRTQRAIGKLNSRVRYVEMSNMSADDKRAELDRIAQVKNSLAELAERARAARLNK